MESNNTTTSNAVVEYDLAYTIIRTFIFFLLAILICFGNVLVIASVVQFRALWTVTNKFLISLSIADTLTSVAILGFFTYVAFAEDLSVWRWGLLLFQFPSMLSQGMSLFTLLHIAIDRYIAVIHAVSYKQLMTHRVANIMIVSAWAYFTTTLGIIIGYYGITTKDEVFKNRRLVEAIPVFVMQGFISPHIYVALVLTCILYARIFRAISLRSKKVGQFQKSATGEAKTRKVTQIMATVLAILLVCWMLISVFNSIVDLQKPQPAYVKYLHDACSFLLYANSFTNPILYGLKSPDFRKAYVNLLNRCLGKKTGLQSLGGSENTQSTCGNRTG